MVADRKQDSMRAAIIILLLLLAHAVLSAAPQLAAMLHIQTLQQP